MIQRRHPRPHLVERPAHGGPDDHAHPEGHLHDPEHGGDRAGEHLGHHREARGQEGGVAERLDDPDDEGDRDEGVGGLDPVEEAEEDAHEAGCQDAAAERSVDANLKIK